MVLLPITFSHPPTVGSILFKDWLTSEDIPNTSGQLWINNFFSSVLNDGNDSNEKEAACASACLVLASIFSLPESYLCKRVVTVSDIHIGFDEFGHATTIFIDENAINKQSSQFKILYDLRGCNQAVFALATSALRVISYTTLKNMSITLKSFFVSALGPSSVRNIHS